MQELGSDGRWNAAAASLRTALQKSCQAGTPLMIGERVFVTEQGPTGDAEAIVFVDVHDTAAGSVYGHVRRVQEAGFASIMLQSRRFVTAHPRLLLFRRFDYWMRCQLDFTPLRLSNSEPSPTVWSEDFGTAVEKLARMISRYTMKQAWFEEHAESGVGIDMEGLKVFSPARTLTGDPTASPRPPAALRTVIALD